MEVSIESPGEIVRRMTIKVPATELEKGVDARIVRFARTAKIPGFRPGKVPRKVAEAQFGIQALHEAAQECDRDTGAKGETRTPMGYPTDT